MIEINKPIVNFIISISCIFHRHVCIIERICMSCECYIYNYGLNYKYTYKESICKLNHILKYKGILI